MKAGLRNSHGAIRLAITNVVNCLTLMLDDGQPLHVCWVIDTPGADCNNVVNLMRGARALYLERGWAWCVPLKFGSCSTTSL